MPSSARNAVDNSYFNPERKTQTKTEPGQYIQKISEPDDERKESEVRKNDKQKKYN